MWFSGKLGSHLSRVKRCTWWQCTLKPLALVSFLWQVVHCTKQPTKTIVQGDQWCVLKVDICC